QFELFSVGLAGDAPDGGPITDFWGEPSGGDPKRRLAFTGVHIVGSELVDSLPTTGFSCIKEAGYLPALRQGRPLYGQIMGGAWFDLGTPARYLGAHTRLMERAGLLSELPEIAPRVWSNTPIPMGVNVCPPVVLGDNVRLHLGSTVGPNVVMGARSEVKPGASIINSVVWEDTIIDEAVWDVIASPHAVVKNTESGSLKVGLDEVG
ncbi:MAG: NDP-sugar pyrophosphorylase family protein, partial [Myxococcota bacterium]